jgi:putative transposase
MIDQISNNTGLSVRQSCRVLGFRRQAYYNRKNGHRPEERGEALKELLQQRAQGHGIELRYIQPGKPSQNGLIERLNKTLRRECLNLYWFTSMEELNESIQAWSVIYNQLRPHKNLGYQIKSWLLQFIITNSLKLSLSINFPSALYLSTKVLGSLTFFFGFHLNS